jgi:choline dehydrogenase-like flavoprotein
MIYDPKKITEEKVLEADICIIGSGAGGAISAAKLAGKHSIIMLEKGPNVTGKDFTQNESQSIKRLYQVQGALTTNDASFRILQGRALGGSTTINWMTSFRTPELVLNQWVEEFGLEDYQPKYMENHFSEVEKRLSVHKVPDEEQNSQNRIILDGCKKLGIHADYIANNSIECIGCGYCGMGCYYDAKQDMRLTYLKDSLATNNMSIYTGVEAEKIQYNSKNEQITTAVTLGKEYGIASKILKIKSKRTIVAGSAIWTPVVFQKSKLTKNKTLGKYLHIHPVTLALGKFDRIIDPSYGIPQSAYSHEYINMDGKGYGFWVEAPPVQPLMAGVNYPGLGEDRNELMKNMRNSGILLVLVRDGANHRSNGEVKWGRGRLNINYKLCKEDKYHLLKGLDNALEILFAAGAQETFSMHMQTTSMKTPADIEKLHKLKSGPNQLSMFSAHPLGTARMGTNPKTSVVGPTMEMYDYPGIYVADGSILPTALGVNPMITILSTISRAFEINSDLSL